MRLGQPQERIRGLKALEANVPEELLLRGKL